ncbi:MAG: D-alanyl-D-alanine carboxypeptidase family protein [Bacilli bacterium]|nr:D-alanyl-D-alanine carboxypeptidase family protein [Bacilli bacterium]
MPNVIGTKILVVTDVKCELYDSNETFIIKKYTLGEIVEEFSKNFYIVKLCDNRLIKLDKKYIIVNLYEIMQKEVIYSIVNADKAIYHIHGNLIPQITGKKLYPNINLNGKPFIPLMLNTAIKLFKAEEDFLKQGLTIKIYDAYRPYAITKFLYKNLLKYTDEYYDFLNGKINNHKYDETDFLAAKTSTHNYGIALDMTLVDLKTNKELEMQTRMHDLSIYSVTDYNNENANILANVMKKNNFAPLDSEWWHFQDNDSKIDYMNFYITDDDCIKEFEL